MGPNTQRGLSALGIKPMQLQAWAERASDALPWRITAVDRGMCDVMGLAQDLTRVEGRVHNNRADVAVGDFVLLTGSENDPMIDEVLPRSSVLRRGASGRRARAQLIATNVDVVFVVSAFAPTEKLERRGLQVRRIERYVAAVSEGGSLPVAILNKVDIATRSDTELLELLDTLRARLHRVDVVCTSAETGAGLAELAPYLTPGSTVGFIGMSGVGKSSLINALLQRESQAVGGTRGADQKGRHTTTRRELVPMPGGAWLIDTPGMREFAVLSADDDVAGFDDIDALAQRCGFANCAHDSEPGCAVRAAVEAGKLERDRLENYRDLRSDAQRLAERHDALARHEAKRKGRAFGRMVREAKRIKGR